MRKEEYLQKLEQLLYCIPAEDREEALQFYRDYLEDAGADVDEVLRSLGTPEELAKSIQMDLYGDNEPGDFTRSYKKKKSVVPARKGKLTAGQWILFLVLCLCAAPVIIPICGTVISVIIALLIAVIAIVFGAGIAGIALVVAAIVVIIVAIVKLIVSPFSALIMVGGGLLMIGIGLIGIAFALWIVCKILPKIFVWLVDVCSRLVHR